MKKRTLSTLSLLAGAAVVLAGCAAPDSAPAPHHSSSLSFSGSDIEALGGQANVDYMEDLYDKAIAAGQTTITVYGITATSSASLYAAFSERFPGIKVDHVTIFGQELQNRIASEQATGQYVVDNVSIGGADAVFAMKNDYIATQKPPLAKDLPKQYIEKSALFGANTYLYTVSYNTDLVAEADVPKTFDDLLDPKWKGKIAIGDVSTGAPGFIYYAMLDDVIDEAWLTKFKANDPVVVPSERDTFTAVSTGQVPLGVNNYIRGDAFLKKDNLPVAFVSDFKGGIANGVFYRGTVKNAPNALASDLLTAWWLTPEAMTLLSIQGQAGLMPGAPAIVGQPPLSDMKINSQPPLDKYTEEMAAGLKLFTKVFSG